ncbi:hypothetical protein DICSQDRAFT_90751 [Dichomitus squalens LYAD-421 SS1]|uniref:Bromodomain-containing protein n=1 Tax=Dichomitus squalens (strain LYAD-421) TaxID=732165 RepID=R7SRV4_DICSQ|nr:uncharacterized protein DICSQDRAFT_90751 [Dichomitus squalens LYAD-421 SS1]EJF58495.1 hypothetical protein DICSQDRAFT_90751 [Dichomitus squalens LYAD-421 SS1]
MPVSAAQKTAIEEVIRAITSASSRRAKRRLADMFMDLVDRESWPEYYEVIPQPRCINGVKANLAQNKYKNPLDAFIDLNLVFLNALHYNEDGSQIAKDANTLKGILESEWRQRPLLPVPPMSPAKPPSATQKGNASKDQKERAAVVPGPIKSQTTAASSSKSQSKAPAKPSPPIQLNSTPSPLQTRVSQTQHSDVKKEKETVTVKAGTPEGEPSQDMDVDIGGTPEPEVVAQDSARDGESEEIVRQLEKGLPRWAGFADVGWTEDLTSDRMVEIVTTLSKYRDESGNRPAASLEGIPEETDIPDLSFTHALSLRLVESRSRMNYYETPQAFDKEMSQLFLKARRWYDPGTEPYGNALALQRFYQALTSSNPPTPPYSSTTSFASLPAGPGTATPLHSVEGDAATRVTTFRVSEKDKRIVEEVHYKGWSIRLADWLHLSNPDDPSRPIIAHVFKCFVSEETQRKGQPGVSVCWYYRPEQTWHPTDRQFWENEVFKTGHFADHPLEDIIEKIAVQFTARHVRGRPRPPFWYPGWPLYVCDSRYHDRERAFVKIKNWNSCIPEEVRKKEEFMQIYPFERPVFPRRHPSPFLSGAKIVAPGGVLDANANAAPGEKVEPEKPESGGAGPGTRTRTRPKRATVQKAEAEKAAASRGVSATPMQPSTSLSYQQQTQPPYVQTYPPREDRSIVAAAGGLAVLGSNAAIEELPPETARHFDRDPETNEVLWFAAPPVDIVHAPPPRHSLKYLAHLARKRKGQAGEHAMDVDGAPPPKRQKMSMTVTETLAALLQENGL